MESELSSEAQLLLYGFHLLYYKLFSFLFFLNITKPSWNLYVEDSAGSLSPSSSPSLDGPGNSQEKDPSSFNIYSLTFQTIC